MTAISRPHCYEPRPSRGLVAALRHSMSRNEFFAGLYILGLANGLLGRALLTVNVDGWLGALVGLDINVIVLFACFAGISTLLLCKDKDEIRSADLAVAVVFLGLVILPIFALSWVAVTGLSLYILLFASGSSDRRRGAIILLALTVPMLWSRLAVSILCEIHFGHRCDAWWARFLGLAARAIWCNLPMARAI